MSLTEVTQILGNLGEFFGSIAVVVTLIYLVVQVRQSARLIEHQGHLGASEQLTQFLALAAGSSELSDVFVRGCRSPSELSEAEHFQFDMAVALHLSAVEFQVRVSADPARDPDAPTWQAIVQFFLAHPGGRAFWGTHRNKFYPEFSGWVDAEVDLSPPADHVA